MKPVNRIKDSRVFGLIADMVRRFFDHDVGNCAAALTYYLIFAFFPFLIFLSSLLALFNVPQIPIDELRHFIPPDVITLINSYIAHVQQTTTAPLFIFGLVFSVYFPIRVVHSLIGFITRAYETQEKHGIVRQALVVVLLAAALVVTLTVSIVVMALGKDILLWAAGFLPLTVSGIELWDYCRFILMGGVLLVMLMLLYLIAPARVVSLRSVLPGALGSLVCWLIYSAAFSFYVERIARYSVVYGSIGTIIVLLVWLYAAAVTLIMGAELNASLEQRRAGRH